MKGRCRFAAHTVVLKSHPRIPNWSRRKERCFLHAATLRAFPDRNNPGRASRDPAAVVTGRRSRLCSARLSSSALRRPSSRPTRASAQTVLISSRYPCDRAQASARMQIGEPPHEIPVRLRVHASSMQWARRPATFRVDEGPPAAGCEARDCSVLVSAGRAWETAI